MDCMAVRRHKRTPSTAKNGRLKWMASVPPSMDARALRSGDEADHKLVHGKAERARDNAPDNLEHKGYAQSLADAVVAARAPVLRDKG